MVGVGTSGIAIGGHCTFWGIEDIEVAGCKAFGRSVGCGSAPDGSRPMPLLAGTMWPSTFRLTVLTSPGIAVQKFWAGSDTVASARGDLLMTRAKRQEGLMLGPHQRGTVRAVLCRAALSGLTVGLAP